MKRQLLRLIPLLLIAFAVGWSPALADGDDPVEHKVKVINRSRESFVLFLRGPENYDFDIPPESSNSGFIVEGEYGYFYEVCGGDFLGEIEVVDDTTKFEIYECNIQPIPTKMVFESHFSDEVKVELIGPLQVDDLTVEQTFNVPLGNSRVDMDSGDYIYSYEACGVTISGELKILKNGTTRLRMDACETLELRAIREQYTNLDPVKFRMANRFAVDIDITLIGPESYFFTITPGMNRVQVIAGTYNYIYAAFGVRYEGIVIVSLNGDTILMVPFTVSSNTKV